ncbi:MAG: hypothetical protein AB1689_08060, partial [Thermodesulfobacteriota bacterium]
MGLKYVVITSVDRDDLRDGGAGHFAACIRAARVRLAGFSAVSAAEVSTSAVAVVFLVRVELVRLVAGLLTERSPDRSRQSPRLPAARRSDAAQARHRQPSRPLANHFLALLDPCGGAGAPARSAMPEVEQATVEKPRRDLDLARTRFACSCTSRFALGLLLPMRRVRAGCTREAFPAPERNDAAGRPPEVPTTTLFVGDGWSIAGRPA